MTGYRHVVVVGASLAGLRAVEALRRDGHEGTITVIGAEEHPPYDRPPLSKRVLTGRAEPSATALNVEEGLDVDWRLGTAATGLDLGRQLVHVGPGESVPFDGLVLATGAHARTLPPLPVGDGVHVLRTLDDAFRLRAVLETGPTVAVVGAGFIGLEVAASCRALDLTVTVLEAAQTPLERSVGAEMGAVTADLHRARGVDVRLGVAVAGIVGTGPVAHRSVEGLTIEDGSVVAADVVVVGVGAAPTTAWLAGSGVDLDDGIRTDGRLRVLSGGRPLPHVVAAGDVVRWDHPHGDGPTRVEHWTNAAEQGGAAAASLLVGDEAPLFAPVPYFWSDQYDRKIQMVGRIAPGDDVAVVDGSVADHRFVAAYGRKGTLVAALGFSRPGKVMSLQRRIADRDVFPPEM